MHMIEACERKLQLVSLSHPQFRALHVFGFYTQVPFHMSACTVALICPNRMKKDIRWWEKYT